MDRRGFIAGLTGAIAACERAVPAAPARPSSSARPRVRPNLYQCEGCEGALERNPRTLGNRARIGSVGEPGERLRMEGVVYSAEGRRPAPNVVIYAYQTSAEGLYAGGAPGSEASRRHGRLRGWIRTGVDGRYVFDTIKPAPYPNDSLPAHIHFTVLEPGRRPYWIDDIVFSGEFGVTASYRRGMVNQGGNGIVRLARAADGVLVARRDIVLERHPG